jgi:hypothetical protein
MNKEIGTLLKELDNYNRPCTCEFPSAMWLDKYGEMYHICFECGGDAK